MWFSHGDSVLQHAQLVHFFSIVCISVGAFQKRAKTYIVLTDLGESPFATAHVFRAVPCRVTRSNHVLKKPFKDNSNLVPQGHFCSTRALSWCPSGTRLEVMSVCSGPIWRTKGVLSPVLMPEIKGWSMPWTKKRRKLVIVNDNRGHNWTKRT